MRNTLFAALTLALAASAAPAVAQPASPAQLIAARKAALGPLEKMDGVWRGPAWTIDPMSGKRHELTQTERVGPMLDGSVKVIEGRGYDADGSVAFNAFAVVSYDPERKDWSIASWAMGRNGVFPFALTDDGYVWTIPAGPKAVIRYTSTITDTTLREVGDYIAEGQEPRRIFEMNLTRVGDTDWPVGTPVPMK